MIARFVAKAIGKDQANRLTLFTRQAAALQIEDGVQLVGTHRLDEII